MQLWPDGTAEKSADEREKARAGAGTYKVTFRTKEYFERTGRRCFYPFVDVSPRFSPFVRCWMSVVD